MAMDFVRLPFLTLHSHIQMLRATPPPLLQWLLHLLTFASSFGNDSQCNLQCYYVPSPFPIEIELIGIQQIHKIRLCQSQFSCWCHWPESSRTGSPAAPFKTWDFCTPWKVHQPTRRLLLTRLNWIWNPESNFWLLQFRLLSNLNCCLVYSGRRTRGVT